MSVRPRPSIPGISRVLHPFQRQGPPTAWARPRYPVATGHLCALVASSHSSGPGLVSFSDSSSSSRPFWSQLRSHGSGKPSLALLHLCPARILTAPQVLPSSGLGGCNFAALCRASEYCFTRVVTASSAKKELGPVCSPFVPGTQQGTQIFVLQFSEKGCAAQDDGILLEQIRFSPSRARHISTDHSSPLLGNATWQCLYLIRMRINIHIYKS